MRLRPLYAALALLLAPLASAQPSTYRIDPARSTIVYAMAHPAHAWEGTSRRVSGTMTVDAAGVVTAATVSAPVQSFGSGNRNRDSHMVEATEAYLYRTVTFALTTLTLLPAPTAAANATATGTLTFHNVAQTISLPVLVQRSGSGDAVRVQGTFDVTLTQFRITPPSLLGVRVRDNIRLTLDLSAQRAR